MLCGTMKNVKNKDILKFFRFLKDNKIYEEYVKSYYDNQRFYKLKTSLLNFLEKEKTKNYIFCAFSFSIENKYLKKYNKKWLDVNISWEKLSK